MGSGAFQVHALGLYPDLGVTSCFESRLEVGLTRPSHAWAPPMSDLKAWGVPVQAGLAEGRPAALEAVAQHVRLFHEVAVEPYWDRLRQSVLGVVAGWTETVSRFGLEVLLNTIHATVAWRAPALSVEVDLSACVSWCPHRALVAVLERDLHGSLAVSSRGLTIVPTVFSRGCMIWTRDEPDRGLTADFLTIPVRLASQALEPDRSPTGSDALGTSSG